MPRFFFHVYDDIEALDEEGQELCDVASARIGALHDARVLACEELLNGRLTVSHRIDVADETGAVVTKVTFGEAFELVE